MARRLPQDWHPEDIKAAVRKSGWTLRSASLAYGLHHDACRQALRQPYFAAEYAIAEILGLSPRQIWPSRYREDGTRPWPTRGQQPIPRRLGATSQKDAAA